MEEIQFNPRTSGWSKTDSNGKPGLSVFEHCRHVGWVALELIHQGRIIPHPQITPEQAAALAAVHDVGKWSRGFLQKCPAWLEQEGLFQYAERNAWNAYANIRHEKLSQESLQLLLQKRGQKESSASAWGMIAGAHHGKMYSPERFGNDDISLFIDEWHSQRHQIIETLETEFGCSIHGIDLQKKDSVVPWLMGLTSVADWIGSYERHFPVDKGWGEDKGRQSARMAVSSIGLSKPQIKKRLNFESIFEFQLFYS